MNVNIKISINDLERNLLKRKLTGKPVKAMVSRKEINELVHGFVEGLLTDLENEHATNFENGMTDAAVPMHKPDLTRVPRKYQDKPVEWQLGWLRGWNKVATGRAY